MKRSAVFNRLFSLFLIVVSIAFINSCKKDEGTSTEPSVYGSLNGNVTEFYTESQMAMVNIYTEPATGFVTTDNSGNYRIDNILPGEYKVYAAKKNYDTLGVSVTINAGTTTYANFILELYDTTDHNYGVIAGIVRDSETELPVSKVVLYTVPSTSVVSTNSGGEYTIGSVSTGKYKLYYGKSGYDTLYADISVIAGKTTTADLTLTKIDTSTAAKYGSIKGKITNSNSGAVISGATITTSPALGSITSDSEGVFTIEKILPGTYTLTVSKTGFTDKEVEVVVSAGMVTTANVAIQQQTGSVSGTIIDSGTGNPLAGVNVKTTPGTSTYNTDSQGQFSISNVAPGTYKIAASKAGYTSVEISVTVSAGLNTNADMVLETETP